MSARLGEFLLRCGYVGRRDLLQALEQQQVFGGRLGTNLVRLGALSEDKLALALSKLLQVPCVSRERLQQIPPAVLELVDREVAGKYQVLPFAAQGQRLSLATGSVGDLRALDDLAFITGRVVSPFVVPEILLLRALKHYYGIARQGRFIDPNQPQARPPAPAPAPPRRLGEFLLQLGLISEGQLRQALECQQVFGGRLGTHLLEQGFVREEELVAGLSRALRRPGLGRKELLQLPAQVLALLPRGVAAKYRLVPLGLQRRLLRVATAEPNNLRLLDEVAFVTGYTIEPLIVPERLLAEALECYYQVPRSSSGILLVPADGPLRVTSAASDLVAAAAADWNREGAIEVATSPTEGFELQTELESLQDWREP
jgi:Type II secretion system (T2SS), protein E, N-terminal domain